jgi:hypothetical protein
MARRAVLAFRMLHRAELLLPLAPSIDPLHESGFLKLLAHTHIDHFLGSNLSRLWIQTVSSHQPKRIGNGFDFRTRPTLKLFKQFLVSLF